MRARYISRHSARLCSLTVALCAFAACCSLAPAAAVASEVERPGWELTARTYPTEIGPGARGLIDVDVFNVGAAASNGAITVTDELPPHVTAVAAGEQRIVVVGENNPEDPETNVGHTYWACTGNGPSAPPSVEGATVVTCTNSSELAHFEGGGGHPNALGPLHQPAVAIVVNAPSEPTQISEANSVPNQATIAGGGAPTPANTSDPISIGSASTSFGVTSWDVWASNADGTIDTQAGSHPYELTFDLDLATGLSSEHTVADVGEPRDIEVELPPGLIGDPTAVPQCPRQVLLSEKCPDASQIGTVTPYFAEANALAGLKLYNMVPPRGEPAQFGFNFEGLTTLINPTVHTGSDYGITATVDNVLQREVVGTIVTLWGVPGERSHTPWRTGRAGGCTAEETEEALSNPEIPCGSFGRHPSLKPFLTLPTMCISSPETFSIRTNMWGGPLDRFSDMSVDTHSSNGRERGVGLTRCEGLAFGPPISLQPESAAADSATALTAEVTPPLGALQEPDGLSSSDLKHAKVTLPEGLVINPGQAAGLKSCGENTSESAIGTEEAANCPEASEVGTAVIKTPLIEGAEEKQIEGHVYILQSNPPEIHLLVAASADGVNLKLVGVVKLNESTGRVETTFGEEPSVEEKDSFLKGHMGLPPLPFSSFKLSFNGGVHAAQRGAQPALATPTSCGAYTTTTDFQPWASPFVSDVNPSSQFNITAGPAGASCPSNPLPFAPTMTAGSTNSQAGAFSPFTFVLQRADAQQRVSQVSLTLPPGISGMISKVPLCGEPQANEGTCSEASKVGHALAEAGPGPNPLVLPQPEKPELPIYLTGPYNGKEGCTVGTAGCAPYGLSIVTPVQAGPFNLGTIVTRAKIEVNPITAQITTTTNPLPQIVKGVPTDLRLIEAVIDRPGFTFNSTNCTPTGVFGQATSAQGATAPLATPFGVAGCRALGFAPKFQVITSGKTSKKDGASLIAKISYPSTPPGSQATDYAGISYAKVALPKQLPSRLETLHKACLAKVFESNPADCPSGSIVGHARVLTPVLPVPLMGPAYFVSHGGESFPSLEMVLQGYGVTLELVGQTFIRKGITTTTFRSTPDEPFSLFELTLPEGPFSALGAFGNLCKEAGKLIMPTHFIAQNGLEVKQNTRIGVTGCARAKGASRLRRGRGG